MAARVEVDFLAEALAALSGAAQRGLALLLQGYEANTETLRYELPAMWEGLVGKYGSASSALGAEVFEQWADQLDLKDPKATMVRAIDPERASARLNWALSTANIKGNLMTLTDELVKQPARSTLMASCRDNNVKFARVPRGRETCAFCYILASRGAVYYSEASAGGVTKFHGDCDCAIVPISGPGDFPEGYNPDGMYDKYQEARSRVDSDSPSVSEIASELRKMEDVPLRDNVKAVVESRDAAKAAREVETAAAAKPAKKQDAGISSGPKVDLSTLKQTADEWVSENEKSSEEMRALSAKLKKQAQDEGFENMETISASQEALRVALGIEDEIYAFKYNGSVARPQYTTGAPGSLSRPLGEVYQTRDYKKLEELWPSMLRESRGASPEYAPWRDYVGEGYDRVNTALREGRTDAVVPALDKFFDGHSVTMTEQQVTWRGLVKKGNFDPEAVYREGSVVEELAYMSSTFDKGEAIAFSRGGDEAWVMEVISPAGDKVTPGVGVQSEVIHARGTKLRIDHVDTDTHTITAVALPPDAGDLKQAAKEEK